MEIEGVPTIPEFFSGLSILITGATGFMGKILLSKLLLSCPDIDKIYVLMRPKRNTSITERLEKLFKIPLFKSIDPAVITQKVIPVMGDTMELDLGLSAESKALLQEKINVVFHVAASVRFDDSLKCATFANVRSTRDIINLSKGMKNFKTFLHVSTSYANLHDYNIEEKIYAPPLHWRDLIQIVEDIPEDLIEILTPKILGKYPNTYTFTKSVAEHIINDAYKENLSVAIVRPSIVVPSLAEPFPGWIDNFNGPAGLNTGVAKGVVRTVYADSKIIGDYIPVDVAINVWIIIAWYSSIYKNQDKDVNVYHCSSSEFKKLSFGDMLKFGYPLMDDIPLTNLLWKPTCFFTKSELIYSLSFIFFHMIPAYIVDAVISLFGNKPINLRKITRRIYHANLSVSYFLLNEWLFQVRNIFKIDKYMHHSDLELFKYDYRDTDIKDFIKIGILGAKQYLFNEPIDEKSMDKARQASKRLKYIHNTLVISLLFLIIYTIKNSGIPEFLVQSFYNYLENFN